MVAEVIAGLITEIINNRVLGNPIFHRFGKKARISPSLSKVMLMIGLFLTAAALMTSLKKTEDLNCVFNVLSSWSSLTLTWH